MRANAVSDLGTRRSSRRTMTLWPDVDVIIPAFNCRSNLQVCLLRLTSQDYLGHLHLFVIDGGSSDGTADVARTFGATVYVNPGQYSDGKGGAKWFGDGCGNSDYVWHVDSDNFLAEPTVARDLVVALENNPAANLAVPRVLPHTNTNGLNRWLMLTEIARVKGMESQGRVVPEGILVEDMDYGITNATMIRRTALTAIGGFDNDLRVLMRLRERSLSKGVIVDSAHFYHSQATSIREFWNKLRRRVVRFGSMSDEDLKEYFVEYPVPQWVHETLTGGAAKTVFGAPLGSLREYVKTRDKTWLWGIVYFALFLGVALRYPGKTRSLYSRFL
jgi:glycosyltransferase involved in cell wall biosynthesis